MTTSGKTGGRIHQLFEAQVDAHPSAIAVEMEGEKLTYAELDERANRLAHYLSGLGVGPDVTVGLCMRRSIEMVVGIFGVLKAGAAYAPLDPGYPPERLAQMIEDCASPVLLTNAGSASSCPSYSGRVVRLDADAAAIAASSGARPKADVHGAHPAYVIFTSGSTGRPKGVVIPHDAIANHMIWMQETFPLGAADAFLQKTPFSFDASVLEFHAPLIAGARLVLAPPDAHRDTSIMTRAIQDHRVTTLQVVPAMLSALLEEESFARGGSLRRVFCGGEALRPDLVKRFQARASMPLINLYGPTEATIDATAWACTPSPSSVFIGQPIAGVTLHVLDEEMSPVPDGTPGELYIGGVGLARGYLRRPDLTAERFVPNPFDGDAGRLYRTGDIVRRTTAGDVEYLSRIDTQIKLRGFRIELGEIESALRAYEGVRDAVALVREDSSDQRLVGYVVTKSGVTLQPAELRAALERLLPEYMVPSAFIVLASWPLTPSGKVDRKALPAPPTEDKRPYTAPRTPTEQLLAEIWAALLNVERVGIHDDFFELGGHSLLAIDLVARLRKATGVRTRVRTIFEAPTIAQLAATLKGDASDDMKAVALTAAIHGDVRHLSESQVAVFAACKPNTPFWRGAGALRLRGPLDESAFAAAIEQLQLRHELLRTVFDRENGTLVFRLVAPRRAERVTLDGSDLEVALQRALERECARPFTYEVGEATVRLTLFQKSAEEHVLLVLTHAMIFTGSSEGVAMDELVALYQAITERREPPPAPKVQHEDFIDWRRQVRATKTYQRQEAYWKTQMQGAQPLQLPSHRDESATGNRKEILMLSPEDQDRLDALGKELGVSKVAIFLTVYFAALHALTRGQRDLCVVQLFEHRADSQLASVIGHFVANLPVRVQLVEGETFATLAKKTMQSMAAAYANADVPGAEILGTDAVFASPLARAVLNVRGGESGPRTMGLLQLDDVPVPLVETRRADLAWVVDQTPRGIRSIVVAAADTLTQETVTAFAGWLRRATHATRDSNTTVEALLTMKD